jgi:hypothetical protein
MNVEDFQIPIPEGDMLETIFNHQRDLIDKYHLIETELVGHYVPSALVEVDGQIKWHHAGALNIQDRYCQLRFKDFAWRITEELTEATLALGEENETHYLEELIDALHFSVELLIMCGMFPVGQSEGDRFEAAFSNSIYGKENSERWHVYRTIEKLGEAMNRLKLKPWKVTAMLTDEKAFMQSLAEFFAALIDLLKASGFTAKSATQMYLNKNAVNQFRIGSKY